MVNKKRVPCSRFLPALISRNAYCHTSHRPIRISTRKITDIHTVSERPVTSESDTVCHVLCNARMCKTCETKCCVPPALWVFPLPRLLDWALFFYLILSPNGIPLWETDPRQSWKHPTDKWNKTKWEI